MKRVISTFAACMVLASQAWAGNFELLGGMSDEPAPQQWLPRKKHQRVASAEIYAPRRNRSLAIETVAFHRNLAPGSILVNTGARELYYVLPGGKALRYPVGVGRDGFTWSGTNRVSRKSEWPDWRPPQVMIEREAKKGHIIPAFMPGGPENPLGARALYIGSTQFRIHGTTQPWSIGHAVSSGCIRLLNEHVIDLFERVSVGATVVVE